MIGVIMYANHDNAFVRHEVLENSVIPMVYYGEWISLRAQDKGKVKHGWMEQSLGTYDTVYRVDKDLPLVSEGDLDERLLGITPFKIGGIYACGKTLMRVEGMVITYTIPHIIKSRVVHYNKGDYYSLGGQREMIVVPCDNYLMAIDSNCYLFSFTSKNQVNSHSYM